MIREPLLAKKPHQKRHENPPKRSKKTRFDNFDSPKQAIASGSQAATPKLSKTVF